MLKGYKKLKSVRPGELVRFRNGTYIIVSEYHNTDGTPEAHLSGSGEYMATCDMNEWVAIIDMESIDSELAEEFDYPGTKTDGEK